jgi:hypothetical protein
MVCDGRESALPTPPHSTFVQGAPYSTAARAASQPLDSTLAFACIAGAWQRSDGSALVTYVCGAVDNHISGGGVAAAALSFSTNGSACAAPPAHEHSSTVMGLSIGGLVVTLLLGTLAAAEYRRLAVSVSDQVCAPPSQVPAARLSLLPAAHHLVMGGSGRQRPTGVFWPAPPWPALADQLAGSHTQMWRGQVAVAEFASFSEARGRARYDAEVGHFAWNRRRVSAY